MPDEASARSQIARFFTFEDKDREWRERAACRDLDLPVAERVALFFPGRGQESSQKEAKGICKKCPVRIECRGYAEVSKSYYGIWGGEARKRYEPTEEPAERLTLVFGHATEDLVGVER